MVATGVISSFAAVLGGRKHDKTTNDQTAQLKLLADRFEAVERGQETRDTALHVVLDAIAAGKKIDHSTAKNDTVARLALFLLGSDDSIDARLQADKPLHVSLLQAVELNAAALLSQIKDGAAREAVHVARVLAASIGAN